MTARLPILLLACLGFGWAAMLDGAPAALPPPALPAAPASGPVAVPALPAPASGPWPEQVARPLFAQGRRPPAPPAAPLPPEAPAFEPPPPVAASGVVARPSGALALLRLADDRVVRAAEGEEVEGWLVLRIDAEGVELGRGERLVRLPVRARAAEGILHH